MIAESPIIETQAAPAPDAPAKLLEVVQSTGVEVATQKDLLGLFTPFFNQARQWSDKAGQLVITDVSQVDEMKLARQSRLALKEIRINVERARKQAKEDSLRRGRAIDGLANFLKFLIEPIETHLLEQETFAERKEAARLAAIKSERETALQGYGVDPSFFNLVEMPDNQYAMLLENSRVAHETKVAAEQKRIDDARIAAEKAEADRIAKEKADAEERQRVIEENARLKREADEREEKARLDREAAAAAAEKARLENERIETEARLERERIEAENARVLAEQKRLADEAAEAERKRVEAERAAAEEKARLEREAIELKAKQEREAAAAIAKAEQDRLAEQARVEREAREKLEREAKAAEDARIAKETAERIAAEKAAAAPDRDKLTALAILIRSIQMPEMATAKGKAARRDIAQAIAGLADTIEAKAGAL